MKKFEILTLNDSKYKNMIISNSFDTPFNNLNCILKDLESLNTLTGLIIFDLLLIVGNGPERFVEAEVENGHFIESTFRNAIIPKSSPLRIETMNLLKYEKLILEASILTSIQKQILMNGRAI
ncbi:type II toxin-antitoxin system RnlB family antitoxin [Fusibacter sp. 3D3]|uniref:type II toxin-antitoxin system RnlB family antitoxin n=1 Tax=Fusibacter sp. 3D3 TaxID=1048380 RepID=UPI000853A012|nr:type II toxin-antitoxin system RnlB family antitoxin [Fusibacter sp. 3D3]GAU78297.1 hypothetical protein F3D3_2930 [Fusibacter sp. 3D3]